MARHYIERLTNFQRILSNQAKIYKNNFFLLKVIVFGMAN